MSRATFKQFSAALDIPVTEEEQQLDEIWGMFASQEKREAAERKRLELQAERGNEAAKMKLRKLDADAEKRAIAQKAQGRAKDEKLKTAAAQAQAQDQGSSAAYRKETGSVRRNAEVYWDKDKKQWVRQDNWSHVGKHD